MSRFFSVLVRPVLVPAALLALAACSSAPAAPKPKPYPALPSDRVSLAREWRVSVGDGLDDDNIRLSPAVGEQRVVAASRDGVLLSVARDTGKVVWKKSTHLPIMGGPAAGYGVVAVATAKGNVVAFSETDGSQKWSTPVGAEVLAAPALSSHAVIVLAADGVIHALSLDKGESLWTYNTMVPPLSLYGNAPPLVKDDQVFVGTSSGKLVLLDANTGVASAEIRVATNDGRSELERMNDIVGGLLLDGDTLYSVGYQSQLTAIDLESGHRNWQYDTSSVNDLAAGLGNVYVTDMEGVVLAIDHQSGKVVWKQPAYQYHPLTNATVVGNVLAVGDDKGNIHLLAQSDGQVRGRIHVSGDPLVSLQGVGNEVFVWDNDGHLSAWKIRTP